jgi:flagellin-like hook-associated protein FlgL
MLINTDLSPETATLTRPQNRTETSVPASTTQNSQAASQLDPSLQRLTDTPVEMQDADWAIQDEAGADQATSFASLNILQQPGTALTSQANQMSQNVLNLLQSTD